MSKFLSFGLMLGGIGFGLQAASAGPWDYGDGGCSGTSYAPAPTTWRGPSSYQPPPAQAAPAPPAASTAPAPPAGRTAQSNSQTYQSFSAEPAPLYSNAPAAVYAAPAYPAYGGFYGSPYYGNPYYGYQSNYRSNERWDNANDHGIPPFSYR
jgi:hypothetical protein